MKSIEAGAMDFLPSKISKINLCFEIRGLVGFVGGYPRLSLQRRAALIARRKFATENGNVPDPYPSLS
jgi:hypothetical protein